MAYFIVTDGAGKSHTVESQIAGQAFLQIPGAEFVRSAMGSEIREYLAGQDRIPPAPLDQIEKEMTEKD